MAALIESLVMNILCVPVGPLQANCYLVSDNDGRACAVDPGGEPERILRLLAHHELTLEAILVTHSHFDHVEGVSQLADATGATVYCSELVEPVLTGSQGCSATGLPIPMLSQTMVRTVKNGQSLKVGQLGIKIVATPGHTPGDVTYEIEGSLFCGDLLFRGSIGRTDFPGGDLSQLLASVRCLKDSYTPDTPVYPGHMEATSLGRELRTNPFLTGLRSDG